MNVKLHYRVSKIYLQKILNKTGTAKAIKKYFIPLHFLSLWPTSFSTLFDTNRNSAKPKVAWYILVADLMFKTTRLKSVFSY